MKKLELLLTLLVGFTFAIICYQLNTINDQVKELRNEQIRTEIIKQTSQELRDSHKIIILSDSADVKGSN